MYEFSHSLAVSAEVTGEGWGVAFSASTDYKESSKVITNGEYVYILSTAKCNYYFSKLVKTKPPNFDEAFLDWIYRLDRTNALETYIQFFELFGTHFPMEVTFGSRFTYEFKMKSSHYETQRERGVNVAASASYHGWFVASGSVSASVDSSQQEHAKEFAKSVTKKTITVGAAPPPDGDALAWASTVKESPVPSSYTLLSIEELFTSDFMKGVNVNYRSIYENIVKYKYDYCKYLMDKGDVDSCETLSPGIVLESTKLETHYESVASTFAECIEQCLEQIRCDAITFFKGCSSNNNAHNTCFMFRNTSTPISARISADWESIVFDSKLRNQIKISDVAIGGIERGFENQTDSDSSLKKCHDLCIQDVHCVAYSYCTCPTKLTKCHLYSERGINRLKNESGTDTYFLSSHRSN